MKKQNLLKDALKKTKTLYRGCKSSEAQDIEQNKTAGGIPNEQDQPIEKPSKEQAIAQVGELADPQFTEYSESQDIARRFSKAEYEEIVEIEIESKYLTEGSGSESGWVVNRAAPILKITRTVK